ncbi:helix-turn-helix domain-containing protein [Faunimonas sp. B44]|uniref:helix-turn-helix domain-containing protein n=1 Tax=Faunimonas sp. B44 TaxID=3461493 RepID=UPI004043E470
MLSDTLSEGLARYRIGEKIRALRKEKKLGLVQLGRHTGLSPAMLSKIERGQLFPTLPTLLRIALVFGVGLDHFFVEEKRPRVAVVRAKDRIRLPADPGAEAPAYLFESLDFPVTERRMEAYYAEFPPGAPASEPHRHDGAELVYVTAGRLAVTVAGEETLLGAGDAISFESGEPHSYRQDGRAAAGAVVVVVR